MTRSDSLGPPATGPQKATRSKVGKSKGSSNAVQRAAIYRKQVLSQQYKKIARLQKAALQVLADKAEEAMLNDRRYHEGLPEAEVVRTSLAERLEKRQQCIQRRLELEEKLAQRQLDYETFATQSRFTVSLHWGSSLRV